MIISHHSRKINTAVTVTVNSVSRAVLSLNIPVGLDHTGGEH